MNVILRISLAVSFLIFGFNRCRPVAADVVVPVEPIEYTAGHADIAVVYEGGQLGLQWSFGGDAILDGVQTGQNVTMGSRAAYVRAADDGFPTTRSDFESFPAGFGFTGLTPGEPGSIWILPQGNTAGLPFLGLNTEDFLVPSDWSGGIEWAMTAAKMPAGGDFSVWQTDGFGAPMVMLATADGIDENDRFTMGLGGHDHANWGFTKEGVYDITFEVSGNHVSDGLQTGSASFLFVVGSATAVPEAGTVTLLALGSLGLIVGGWHQRRRRSVAKGEAVAA